MVEEVLMKRGSINSDDCKLTLHIHRQPSIHYIYRQRYTLYSSLLPAMASKQASSSDVTGGEQQKLLPSGLPIRKIPGGYGVPFFSPLRDRLDYFYF
ncbi:hypothetical protein BAE44_0021292 [Dichanthelium oligosanthes]|uniref:Uncharacterized protein n=1 Tax=Dichanthelium oligosanthes TaxID=888268 RepID=A0A1E5UXS0_9POAL|nr:hypothetical protein BAE44_0021292 [Dichanthelium oligosanthes]